MIVEHAVCLGCGCACDDVTVVVRGGRIVEARQACTLGVSWFGDGLVPSRARIEGRDVTPAEALDAAAALLTRASGPLVYLAPGVSTEAQRESVALADVLRASLDSVTSATAMPFVLAAQERGRAAATVGEIRNRADVVVFWGIDPSWRYPRFLTRYAPEPAGLDVPDGRRSRRVVAVDIGRSSAPADADVRLVIDPSREVAALTLAAEQVGGRPASAPSDDDSLEPIARELSAEMRSGRYVAVVADAEPDEEESRDTGRAAALVALTHALNASTRCALCLLRAGGNRSGADAVMTSHTGYPAAVGFARGWPRYEPYDGHALARLERHEIDAIVAVGASANIPTRVLDEMSRVPCIVVGPSASEGPLAAADVVIDTGMAGIHEDGSALRLDDVPLPLRGSLAGPPGTREMVRELCDRVTRRP